MRKRYAFGGQMDREQLATVVATRVWDVVKTRYGGTEAECRALRQRLDEEIRDALVTADFSDSAADPLALVKTQPAPEELVLRAQGSAMFGGALDDALNTVKVYGDTAAERAVAKGNDAVIALRSEVAASTRAATDGMSDMRQFILNAPEPPEPVMLRAYLANGMLDTWFSTYRRWRVDAEAASHGLLRGIRRVLPGGPIS